jgi:hypothetical protein
MYWHFVGASWIAVTLETAAECSDATSGTVYQITQSRIAKKASSFTKFVLVQSSGKGNEIANETLCRLQGTVCHAVTSQ